MLMAESGDEITLFRIGQILHGRFPMNPREDQTDRQPHGAGLQIGTGVSAQGGNIAFPKGGRIFEDGIRMIGMEQGFEMEMREQKRGVKNRIAEPADLRIDQHHAVGRDQNILGTEIAVHETERGLREPCFFRAKERCELGQALGGRLQIWFEPELLKVGEGREFLRDLRIAPSRSVDLAENIASALGVNRIGAIGEEFAFPVHEIAVEKLHRKPALIGLRVEHAGHAAGCDFPDAAQIVFLDLVAGNIGKPM